MDKIDEAVIGAESRERKETPDSFAADFVHDDGRKIRVVVPFDFDADLFETTVALLIQLRNAAEQKKAAARPESRLVLPDRRIVT